MTTDTPTPDASAPEDLVPDPYPYEDRFICPQPTCGVFAHQMTADVSIDAVVGVYPAFKATVCQRCHGPAMWVRAEDGGSWLLAFPQRALGLPPHSDMPPTVTAIYEEARAVAQRSPRSGAGLLRLALQMLIDDLEPGAGTLDVKIGKLVGSGLDPRVQKAMDIVRVVGNNAVHPGQISLDDDPNLLPSLFRLINMVVEEMISRPKHLDQLFELLPEQAREGIERRNSRAMEASGS
ncbi:protein of unknown function [Micromonospora rhizosphaerae]|uniref:DUF4145 domain-containing protein n=1 Tax=Micromonospora rhizosphaerae TaxID=568872 RepID=A0A1C6S0V5_9ACTN|nr:DUF4145 domain-containing protein [Micromonospora rhizosphaerae]SCL22920.1 protein of unknown function [Micromonospora rhizosphaerae]